MAEKKVKLNVDSLHERIVLSEKNAKTWVGSITGKLAEISNMMWAVILVLALGFITLLITVFGLVMTYYHDKQSADQSLQSQLQAESVQIQVLTDELRHVTTSPTPSSASSVK
jgi:hypothetical protein